MLLPLSTIPDCGQHWDHNRESTHRQGRIVGGNETQFGNWPWQAQVKESTILGRLIERFSNWLSKLFTKHKCGGVLITDRHVLTAAHCKPSWLASLMVELGEHDITGRSRTESMPTLQRKVKRVHVHKDYKARTFENDIAILELESDIVRQPHIVPICMPETLDKMFVGKMGVVTGWGITEEGMYVILKKVGSMF